MLDGFIKIKVKATFVKDSRS